jgi:hypothetical protein
MNRVEERAVGGSVAANDFDDTRPLGALDARGRGEVQLAHPPLTKPAEQPESPEASGNALAIQRVSPNGRE